MVTLNELLVDKNIHKQYEAVLNDFVEDMWNRRDDLKGYGKYLTVPLDFPTENNLRVSAVYNNNQIYMRLALNDYETKNTLSDVLVSKGLFGKSVNYQHYGKILDISPIYLDVAVQRLIDNIPKEELLEQYVDANKKSLPQSFLITDEIVDTATFVSLDKADVKELTKFTFVPEYGKLEVRSVFDAKTFTDKRLLFADYRGNLLCYNSEKEAQTALNLMVDHEYIRSRDQRFRQTDMNNVMTVDSINEVTAVIYDSLSITDESFSDIVDDLTRYQEQTNELQR
jgi:hypothetical protein